MFDNVVGSFEAEMYSSSKEGIGQPAIFLDSPFGVLFSLLLQSTAKTQSVLGEVVLPKESQGESVLCHLNQCCGIGTSKQVLLNLGTEKQEVQDPLPLDGVKEQIIVPASPIYLHPVPIS